MPSFVLTFGKGEEMRMHIDRTTFNDAQNDHGVGGAAVIDRIDKALAIGKRVIIKEPYGSESLLQPGDAGQGKYKTTPIAKS